jgi:exosortase C (VPDSG-CTERM-specific)
MTPKALADWVASCPDRRRIGACIGLAVLLIVAFWRDLLGLAQHSLLHELHSHVLLVPVIAGYSLYMQSDRSQTPLRTSVAGAASMVGIAIAALGLRVLWRGTLSTNDDLSLMALGFVCLVIASGFLCLGAQWMKAAAFPAGLLLFMIPMPDAVAQELEVGSVSASADVSAWLFTLTGTPLLRDGNWFALPGITLHVARECSGIRSSWVLLVTSLIAAHALLKGPWRRALLVLFVIPLGIVRNAFRILVIGLLCVHVGPHMSDSLIHRQGGPLFFILALGPLFTLLWWLRLGERGTVSSGR